MELRRVRDRPAESAGPGKTGTGWAGFAGPAGGLAFPRLLLLFLLLFLLPFLACRSVDGPPVPAPPEPASQGRMGAGSAFSGQVARNDLESLLALGARRPGSSSAARAAAWLEDELVELGAEVESWGPAGPGSEAERGPVGAVVGILPGESSDSVLLLARYDTLPGERDGGGPRNAAAAAAPALVLELGRVLAASPRPYSVWLVFVAGDGMVETPSGASSDGSQGLAGSEAVADELEARGMLETARLAIFFGPLSGPSSTMQRDLHSHRFSREVLWQSAESLGATAIFPERVAYDSPQFGHRALLDRGLRQTVGLTGAETPTGVPSADFLAQVGRVTLEATARIEDRLQRIDAFSREPAIKPEPMEGPSLWPVPDPPAPEDSRAPLSPTPLSPAPLSPAPLWPGGS